LERRAAIIFSKKIMKMLDLFAGIGGASLAAHRLGIQTTQFVEIEPAAQLVLKAHFPNIPIHDDIKTYFGEFKEADIIFAGFPCTNTSRAGKREGINGRGVQAAEGTSADSPSRESNLWWEAWRIINRVRPQFVVVENPTGLLDRGLNEVISSLAAIGYVGEWFCIRASQLGAGHRRDRLFVISYPDRQRMQIEPDGWAEQMRGLVQEERADSTWGTVERKGDGDDYGLSEELVRSGFTVPTNYPGRIKARVLAGRTVCPAQAIIALRRILQRELFMGGTPKNTLAQLSSK
jgi:DNA (cytosine-5)-methyltransferase 1